MKKQKGFTLLELILVIIVLGIIAVSIDFTSPGKTVDLYAQTQQVATAVRYAQALSMSRDKRYRINFTSTTYGITDLSGTAVNDPTSGQATVTLNSGITLSSSGLPNDYIAFNGRGTPYTDSAIPGTALSSNAVVTLAASGETSRTVTISPQTGYVAVG